MNNSKIKNLFPIFRQDMGKYPLCYLDSAASAQKPQIVIDKISEVYQEYYANIHRGLYKFSQKTTIEYEEARQKIANYFKITDKDICVFTKNATEAINLVASSWGRKNLNSGDEILLTEMEHHANLVPWYMLAQEKNLKIKYVPLLNGHENGLDIEKFQELITDKTKLVAITHMSNVTGEILPVKKISQMAHAVGAKILIDGSQAAVHLNINLADIGADFYVITGHKLYGPTGIGALFANKEILNNIPPYQGGGEMIENVSFDKITYKEAPAKFEAGTPPFIEAITLAKAIDFMQENINNDVRVRENNLANMLVTELQNIAGITIYGTNIKNKGAIVSFNIADIHPHDIATILDQMNICIRAGQHCAEPFMQARGITSTIRASFAIYNDEKDIENLIIGIKKAQKLFL